MKREDAVVAVAGRDDGVGGREDRHARTIEKKKRGCVVLTNCPCFKYEMSKLFMVSVLCLVIISVKLGVKKAETVYICFILHTILSLK